MSPNPLSRVTRPGAASAPVEASNRIVRRARAWHRVVIPRPDASPASLTGHRRRAFRRRDVAVPDPVSAAAVRVAVWEAAADPAPGRPETPPPLLVVHGFRGDHHGLALLADCLPEFAVHAVELPGFGASQPFPDAEHTVAHHADALRRAVDALGLTTTPVVVGHSYGTVVAGHALAAARADEEAGRDGGVIARVRSTALLNPIAVPAFETDGSPGAAALAAAARAYYRLAAALPERAGRWVLGAPPVVWATTVAMSRTQDRDVLAYTHDQHRRYFSSFASTRMLDEAYRGSSTGTVLAVADRLRGRVLLVAGAQDPLGSVGAQRDLAAAVAAGGAEVQAHVLDGVGHLLHYERPAECAALLRAWLMAPST